MPRALWGVRRRKTWWALLFLCAAGAFLARLFVVRQASSQTTRVAGGGGTPCRRPHSTPPLPDLFLFIGVLSGQDYQDRRQGVRQAWLAQAQKPGEVVSKFILSEDERHKVHTASTLFIAPGCMQTRLASAA